MLSRIFDVVFCCFHNWAWSLYLSERNNGVEKGQIRLKRPAFLFQKSLEEWNIPEMLYTIIWKILKNVGQAKFPRIPPKNWMNIRASSPFPFYKEINFIYKIEFSYIWRWSKHQYSGVVLSADTNQLLVKGRKKLQLNWAKEIVKSKMK